MYTKRMFQWKMDRYSYYNMIQVYANAHHTVYRVPKKMIHI